MELRKRVAIFVTFIFFSVGIGLICAALGTDHWIESEPVDTRIRRQSNITEASTTVLHEVAARAVSTAAVQEEEKSTKNRVHSGLFNGIRSLDWGLGLRSKSFSSKLSYVYAECPSPFMTTVREEIDAGISFISLGIWISVILFSSLALLWAVIGIIFALVNTVIRPIETITGPLGLYVWSSLSAFCVFVSIVLFVVQYFISIRQNVLLKQETDFGFTSQGYTWLGFSFWLLVGAVCCFLFNIFLLLVSGMEMKTRYPSKEKEMPHIADGGVLMY